MTPAPVLPLPQRLLCIRLDRIGDVALSTPVFRALRRRLPDMFLAVMVRPACRDVVDGHPDINEVLTYDKDGQHRSVAATIQCARSLRRYRFDAALVLHPSNRSHWIPFLAGIPVRVGYGRNQPWLLTRALPHLKQHGALHEAVYTLQLLAAFGIEETQPEPFVPVAPQALAAVRQRLAAAGIAAGERYVVLHPSASCLSKRWMPERFAEVADCLAHEHGVKVCLVAGPEDRQAADAVQRWMRIRPANLAGELPVAELIACLSQAALLISNDSGPVHLAAGVGTPVVAIFGRNQPGLSQVRWRPLGAGHTVLQKDVGCITCLAHRCDIGFLCLTALGVDEVYEAARRVLQRS